MRLGLICSAGGHLYELYCLQPLWNQYDRFWVSFDREDSRYLLRGEKIYLAYAPTNRHLKNFWRNLILAVKILRRERPQVIISTGAGLAVPFFLVGKLLGIKSIFIESMTRVNSLSLTGLLVYYLADRFLVQWPELAQKYSRAIYRGQVI